MKRATEKKVPSPISERRMQLRMVEHTKRVKTAKPAIDCRPPPVYGHLVIKMKKLQLENERVSRIEDENFRLLSRLSDIMHRDKKPQLSAKPRKAKPLIKPEKSVALPIKTEEPEISPTRQIKDSSSPRPFTVAVSSNDARKPLEKATSLGNGKPNLCGCKSRTIGDNTHVDSAANRNPETVGPVSDNGLAFEQNTCLLGIQSVQIKPKTSFLPPQTQEAEKVLGK